jgi:hypothetical protein
MNKRTIVLVLIAVLVSINLMIFGFRRFNKEDANPIQKREVKQTTISVKNKKLDLGMVQRAADAKIDFFVYNTGGENLYLNSVEVSCSCSSVTQISDVVLPGDSILITVQYDKKIPGYFYSDVLIHGNFPSSPEILGFSGRLPQPEIK